MKTASECGERIRVRCHAPRRLRTGRDADVAAAHRVGLRVAKGFDWQSLDEPTRPGLARAATTTSAIIEDTYANAAEAVRGWRYTMGGGQAGFDYALRAAMAANLTGANVPEEMINAIRAHLAEFGIVAPIQFSIISHLRLTAGSAEIEGSRDVVRLNSFEMIQNDFRLTAPEIHAARAIGRECISRNDTR